MIRAVIGNANPPIIYAHAARIHLLFERPGNALRCKAPCMHAGLCVDQTQRAQQRFILKRTDQRHNATVAIIHRQFSALDIPIRIQSKLPFRALNPIASTVDKHTRRGDILPRACFIQPPVGFVPIIISQHVIIARKLRHRQPAPTGRQRRHAAQQHIYSHAPCIGCGYDPATPGFPIMDQADQLIFAVPSAGLAIPARTIALLPHTNQV